MNKRILSVAAGLICATSASTLHAKEWRSGFGESNIWAHKVINVRGIDYGLQNNAWGHDLDGFRWQEFWGSWDSKTLKFGGNHGHQNKKGLVKSYPSIVRGWRTYNGFDNGRRHHMGVRIGNLRQASVEWHFQAPKAGRYQALIDIYIHRQKNPSGMVLPMVNIQLMTHVEEYQGYLLNPANIGRGSSKKTHYVGRRRIGGIQYDMWKNWDHPDPAAHRLIHVRPTTFRKKAKHNIKGIIDWGKETDMIKNHMHLTSIQAGWEWIDRGKGGRFYTSYYNTKVNNK